MQIIFDIETQKLADEVGGWDHIDKMGFAIGVTYSTETDSYRVFQESQVQDMIDQLESADCVIGYNIKGFDYHVLKAYSDKDFWSFPTFDMLEKIYATLGFRLSLGNLATETLGMPKFADGLTSVKWWKEGKVDKIIEYCTKDVLITKKLYEYACDKGRLWFMDKYGQQRFVDTLTWRTNENAEGYNRHKTS